MKNYNLKLVAGFILLAFQLACGETQTVSNSEHLKKDSIKTANAKKQANEFYEAFFDNNFDKVFELTHNKVIEEFGGREKFISSMKKVAEMGNSKDFNVVSWSLENPKEIIKAEDQLFVVLSRKLFAKVQKGKIVQEGSLVGISSDDGVTWKFVNGSTFKDFFPSLISKIQIIEDKPPVEVKDN